VSPPCARDEFLCSLGLMARHSGTGSKMRMGGLRKQGDPCVRYLLIGGSPSKKKIVSCPVCGAKRSQRRPDALSARQRSLLSATLLIAAWANIHWARALFTHKTDAQNAAPSPQTPRKAPLFAISCRHVICASLAMLENEKIACGA
jgi:hypothetical protein